MNVENMRHGAKIKPNCFPLLYISNIFRVSTLFTRIKRTTPRVVQDWDLTTSHNHTHTHTHTHKYIIYILHKNVRNIDRGRDHLEDPGVYERIILRWVFRKWDLGVWTRSSWPRIGTSGRHL
jgi:hypothetical protein